VVAQYDVPIYLAGVGTVIAYNTDVARSQIHGQIVSINFTEGHTAHTAYAVLSEGWLSQVQKARRLLRFHRVRTGRLDRRRTVPKDQLTAEDIGGPWRPRAELKKSAQRFCGKKSGCFEKPLAQRVRGSRRARIKSSPTDAI
jgi:hypothetical protein